MHVTYACVHSTYMYVYICVCTYLKTKQQYQALTTLFRTMVKNKLKKTKKNKKKQALTMLVRLTVKKILDVYVYIQT